MLLSLNVKIYDLKIETISYKFELAVNIFLL